MTIVIIIFFVSIIILFGMLMFRAWEIKTSRAETPVVFRKIIPEIYFRHTEKIVLYLTKHIVQSAVLILAKYWFIVLTKIKKWTNKYLPKVIKLFRKEKKDVMERKDSFIRRAILESKIKIKHVREKVRRDHGSKI